MMFVADKQEARADIACFIISNYVPRLNMDTRSNTIESANTTKRIFFQIFIALF